MMASAAAKPRSGVRQDAPGATGPTGTRSTTLNVGAIIGGLGVVGEEAVGAIDLLGQLHKAFGDGGVDVAMQKQDE